MDSGDETLGGHPFVVAHRGASADRPEHTRAAYELALQEGADGVECDVRLTRDGHLVCVHDRRVDRCRIERGNAIDSDGRRIKNSGCDLARDALLLCHKQTQSVRSGKPAKMASASVSSGPEIANAVQPVGVGRQLLMHSGSGIFDFR